VLVLFIVVFKFQILFITYTNILTMTGRLLIRHVAGRLSLNACMQ